MLSRLKSAVKASPIGEPAQHIYIFMRLVPRAVMRFMRRDGKCIRRYLSAHDVRKLQLGSGTNILDGWLNSDYDTTQFETIFLDATGKYPFEDDTFDYVFSEHMIEHVSFEKGQTMLRECFRVLRDGGKIRISTPDMAFLISLYGCDKSELQKAYINWAVKEFLPDAPLAEDTFVINSFVRNWGHTFIYDEKTLRFCLANAGFAEIKRYNLNQSDDRYLCDLEHAKRMPEGFLQLESLVMEAVKRGSGSRGISTSIAAQ
jgi:predicted SAM-dependent methyltransferase